MTNRCRRSACAACAAAWFLDQRLRDAPSGPTRRALTFFGIGGDQFELRVNQKIFDEPFEPLAGFVDFLPDFGDFARLERGGGMREQFGVGQDAVERRAHFVRHHQADVVAQMGEFAFGLVADGLRLFEPRVHGGVKRVGRERFGQVIVRAQFHAVPHAGVVGQAGHQDERDGGGGRFVAQRGERQIAVHLVHVDVAEDEVGQFLARLFDALGAIGGLDDFKAAAAAARDESFRAAILRRQ